MNARRSATSNRWRRAWGISGPMAAPFSSSRTSTSFESIYSRGKSIVANSAVRVAFAVNDEATAKMLSNQLGQTTVTSRSVGISQASDAFLRHNAQAGFAEAGGPCSTPRKSCGCPRQPGAGFHNRRLALGDPGNTAGVL